MITDFKTFHDIYINLSEAELIEFRDNFPTAIPIDINKTLPNKRDSHKDIDKLWGKFLKDIKRIGYVKAKGSTGEKITLHKKDINSKDLSGRFVLRI